MPRPAGDCTEGAGAEPEDLLNVVLVGVGGQGGRGGGGQAGVEATRLHMSVKLSPRVGPHTGNAGPGSVR